MPRKTKDQNEVKNKKKSKSLKQTNAKKDSIIDKIKQTLNISSEEEINDKKIDKVTSKKTSTKSTSKKDDDKKSVSKKNSSKKSISKTSSKKSSSKTIDKKVVTKISEESTPRKKSSSNKTSTEKSKKGSTKEITSVKTKKEATKKSTTSKNKTSSKTKRKAIKQVEIPQIVEYYDLPYRYNQTLVKLLYQTPTTLFVYWDISDNDRDNYKHIYGENFFEITKPVLIIHNITFNYSQEIDINDFANSWYIQVRDSNCEYIVELGRRPIYYNSEIKEDYIYISTSNDMTIPNDKILFNIDILDSLYFRNVKSGENKYIKLMDLIKQVNPNNFPLINLNSLNEIYKVIYGTDNIEEIYNLNNPSSGNPSSNSLSSRFL